MKTFFVFEVCWRSRGGQTIAGMTDGVEEHVVWVVIHYSQKDFIDVAGQIRGCLEIDMMMEFRDRKIVFLGSIANPARSVDHWIVPGVRIFIFCRCP